MINPAEIEANDGSDGITVEWRGEIWYADSPDDWGPEMYEAWDDEKLTHFMKALLGDQYKRFRKAAAKGFRAACEDFMSAYSEAAGIDPGE